MRVVNLAVCGRPGSFLQGLTKSLSLQGFFAVIASDSHRDGECSGYSFGSGSARARSDAEAARAPAGDGGSDAFSGRKRTPEGLAKTQTGGEPRPRCYRSRPLPGGEPVTDPLLAELEERSRAAATGLEAAGKLPTGFVARCYPLTKPEARELRRLQACAALASDVDTFCALARGEAVPRHRLNAELLELHARRTAA